MVIDGYNMKFPVCHQKTVFVMMADSSLSFHFLLQETAHLYPLRVLLTGWMDHHTFKEGPKRQLQEFRGKTLTAESSPVIAQIYIPRCHKLNYLYKN